MQVSRMARNNSSLSQCNLHCYHVWWFFFFLGEKLCKDSGLLDLAKWSPCMPNHSKTHAYLTSVILSRDHECSLWLAQKSTCKSRIFITMRMYLLADDRASVLLKFFFHWAESCLPRVVFTCKSKMHILSEKIWCWYKYDGVYRKKINSAEARQHCGLIHDFRKLTDYRKLPK